MWCSFVWTNKTNKTNIVQSVICTKTAFISESGLDSLVLSSKLPQAREFNRWVTSELLPQIRISMMWMITNLPTNKKIEG